MIFSFEPEFKPTIDRMGAMRKTQPLRADLRHASCPRSHHGPAAGLIRGYVEHGLISHKLYTSPYISFFIQWTAGSGRDMPEHGL